MTWRKFFILTPIFGAWEIILFTQMDSPFPTVVIITAIMALASAVYYYHLLTKKF